MSEPASEPIASRQLTVSGEPQRVITVTIGKPIPDPDPSGDWMCLLDIQGIPESGSEWVHGIDGVQAIQIAFEGARNRLDASGLPLVWAGFEPGETGFPRHVPYSFGRFLARKIERPHRAGDRMAA